MYDAVGGWQYVGDNYGGGEQTIVGMRVRSSMRKKDWVMMCGWTRSLPRLQKR